MSTNCVSHTLTPPHTQAAARGIAGAQYNLGVRYEMGKGLAQDGLRALKFYHQVTFPLAPFLNMPLTRVLRASVLVLLCLGVRHTSITRSL